MKKKKEGPGMVVGWMPLNPTLGKQRQEDIYLQVEHEPGLNESQGSQDYKERSCLENRRKEKRRRKELIRIGKLRLIF